MKRFARNLVHNWRVKLACLAAAILIWLFIKHNISEDPARDDRAPAAALAPAR